MELKLKNVLLLFMMLVTAATISGRNRWNISAGANLSHMCERTHYGPYGWGAGGFLTGGLEINFNRHWSLMPQVELSYVDNGARLDAAYLDKTVKNSSWRGSLGVVIPVSAAFRFNVSEATAFRIAAGPYLQEALSVRRYDDESDKNVTAGIKAIDRLNFGLLGELAVETGTHFAYTFSARYPLLKETWSRQTLTMSVGVRYFF